MSRCILLLVALAACAATVHSYSGRCSAIRGMENFDPNKLVGDWYVISGKDKELGNTHCTKMQFSILNATVVGAAACNTRQSTYSIIFKSLDTEEKEAIHRVVMQSDSGMNSMGVSVLKPDGTDKWSDNYHTSFPITDYDNYMIFAACWSPFDPSSKTFQTHSVARIYGRRPVMNGEVVKTLNNLMKSMDIDISEHVPQDQSKCGWASG